jgi:hypothetical protein
MKKLAVLMMIPALAMFMVPALASANWDYWWGIQGNWEMVASGSCLHSSNGFDLIPATTTPTTQAEYYAPKAGGFVWAATTFAEATWTFERDGSGAVSGWNYVIDFPPGRPVPIGTPPVSTQTPNVRKNPIAFKFHYSVAGNGDIVVTFDAPFAPPFLPAMYGKVSISRMAMTLWSAYEPQQGGVAICNTGRTLIRVIE